MPPARLKPGDGSSSLPGGGRRRLGGGFRFAADLGGDDLAGAPEFFPEPLPQVGPLAKLLGQDMPGTQQGVCPGGGPDGR